MAAEKLFRKIGWVGLAVVMGVLLAALQIGWCASREPEREDDGPPHPTTRAAPLAAGTSFQVARLAIPTYPYTPFLLLQYDGPYAYHKLDWASYAGAEPVSQDYVLLVMENDYVRVTLLPELGGRVYQMIFKPTGHNELYQNPVIKPTHWGPPNQEWWLAVGGIEWGLPVDEHGYEWGEPWSWSVASSTAGVTVTVQDTLARDRLRATIDLFLPSDRALLVVSPRLENPTAQALDFKYWTNAMLAPGSANTVSADLRLVFAAPEMSVHSTGDTRRFPCADPTPAGPTCTFSWPVHNGRDYSRLGNWREWLGFFEYPQAASDFMGAYDTSVDEGVARVFPPDVARGTKGFGFGWSDPIDPAAWTDDGSTYFELHGGVAPTFWDEATLDAGAALTWSEYWYPVAGIGFLSHATTEAALSVCEESGNLRVGVHSTAARADRQSALYVWDKATCEQVARMDLAAIDAAHPYLASVSMGGRAVDELAVVYADSAGRRLAGDEYPTNCLAPDPRVELLPPWVETTSFPVAWGDPADWWAGGVTNAVQFRDGYEGAWTDWLTETRAVSATFQGAHGHTYFFRARTLWGDGGEWTDEEWGQAFATVLVEPAAVLVTSRKMANGRGANSHSAWFLPGEAFSYTVLLSNTGNLAATVALTDPLPAGMSALTETFASDSGLPPGLIGDAIQWSGAVPAGESVRLTYVLSPTVDMQPGERVTNTALIAGSVMGGLERQAVAWPAWGGWLPLIIQSD